MSVSSRQQHIIVATAEQTLPYFEMAYEYFSFVFQLHLAKNFGTVIKQHYERILLPYDVMKSGLLVEVS